MHLLAAQAGSVDDGSEPVDLGQTPADIVFISAADTELAALSGAYAELSDPPSLRLASLSHLAHPMSVDLHLDTCATKSRLVIARVLGGAGYWTYGLEQYSMRLAAAGVPFAALPGDDKPDETLLSHSTIPADDWHALWAFLVEGGAENAAGFLTHAKAMLKGQERPPAARPLQKAGVYWPGAGRDAADDMGQAWREDAPVVPIVFYRALVQGAGLNPINRLIRALLQQGLNPLPVFVSSLKDTVSAGVLEALFREHPPSLIINATSFATGTPNQPGTNPLASDFANNAPVLQVVLSGGTEEAWETGAAGLSARDIAMNVALPEVDGRVLTRAISFKDQAYFDEATECPIATYRAQGGRIAFVAEQAAALCRLRHTDIGARKVALILANYPNKDGRLANGVGLDTPQATVDVMAMLGAEGYKLEAAPETSDALMSAITAGPTNWLVDRASREGGVRLSLDEYRAFYDELPYAARAAMEDAVGQPRARPVSRRGRLRAFGS